MRDISKVFKFEFLTVLRRRSFILSLILVPLIPSFLLGALNLINQEESQSLQEIFIQEVANPLPIGVVDLGNVIKEYPDWLTQGRLVPEVSEEEAREKTAAGQLQGFYVIEPDYLETGKMRFIKPQISMITELLQQDVLKDLVNYNLLGADQERYMRFMNPTTFAYEYLNPETADTRDQSNAATYWVPYAVTMFFYMIILISSGLMLNAVTKDKENKTIEILLSSAKPLDLFIGKILAFGSLSLTQMVIWFGTLVMLVKVGKTSLPFLQNISIPTSVIVASVPFFIGGFLLYGSLMAGMGAVAPNLREGNQATFVLNLPLIFTVISINQLIETPFSSFTTFMTLFPFTSPVVMLTRLSVGPVPAWQLIASIVLLIGTVITVIRGVANLFSSQYLLSGQKMNISVFLRTVFIGHRRA
jgi:ABC-2 type transport system permease protein